MSENSKEQANPVDLMKALNESKIFNNFPTNYQFAKDLSLELIRGSASKSHIETLKESLKGIKEFIEVIEEKIKENNKNSE